MFTCVQKYVCIHTRNTVKNSKTVYLTYIVCDVWLFENLATTAEMVGAGHVRYVPLGNVFFLWPFVNVSRFHGSLSDTIDGSNPAPVDRLFIPYTVGPILIQRINMSRPKPRNWEVCGSGIGSKCRIFGIAENPSATQARSVGLRIFWIATIWWTIRMSQEILEVSKMDIARKSRRFESGIYPLFGKHFGWWVEEVIPKRMAFSMFGRIWGGWFFTHFFVFC